MKTSSWLAIAGVVLLDACGSGGSARADEDDQASSETAGSTTGLPGPISGTSGPSGTADDSGSSADSGTSSGTTAGDEPWEVVDCGDSIDVAPEGTCAVDPGQSGILMRGDVLAPDVVYRSGGLLIDAAGIIQCVGCDCESEAAAAQATVVSCAEAVISPGLINPHDHITYVENAPIGQGSDRYEHRHQWRLGLDGHAELDVPGQASTAAVLAAEFRFLMSGATSAASAGGRSGLIRNLDVSGQMGDLWVAAADSDTFPLADSNGTMIESGCDYSGSRTQASDIAGLTAYLPHISEGINQAARNELTCTSMGANDLLAPQTAVVHAVGIGAEEAQLLADDFTKVVWSPRSNVVLYGNTAPVTLLDTMGVPIALGTDWVASGSMNMLRELRCAGDLNADYFGNHFDARELWQMVTTNAALATGVQHALGQLKPHYVADIAVFRANAGADFQAVVDAELADVVMVMRGGQALYGDATLIESLVGSDCEALDVCGSSKRACIQRDTGSQTLESLRNEIEQTYPLFFCGVPDNEPTCVPSRNEYSGTITAGDRDGDGIADGSDNCPEIFNPIRPLEAMQADADADTVGDVCDPCPLDSTDACTQYDADDIDDDGEPNGTDNCPLAPNSDQADADDDGHGDACDSCPLWNPGMLPCALEIPALRNPDHPEHPSVGSPVLVSGVYVTAVRRGQGSQGFYVQDPTGGPFSAIFVYTNNSTAAVEVGHRVTVSGTYTEFYGASQITSPSITVEDSGITLPFAPQSIADPSTLSNPATAEAFESMLVRVDNVTITDPNPDSPADYDEFEVTGGLRVDDLVTDNAIGSGLGNNCSQGTQFSSIVGIAGYSHSNYKLYPRDETDFSGASDCNPFE